MNKTARMKLIQKVAYRLSKHATPVSPVTTEKFQSRPVMDVARAQAYKSLNNTHIPSPDIAEWARKARETIPPMQQPRGVGAGIGHIIQNRNKMMQTIPPMQPLPGLLGTPTPGVVNPTKAVPQNKTSNNPGILSPEHVANMKRLEYNAIRAPFENGNLVKYIVSRQPITGLGIFADKLHNINRNSQPQNQQNKTIMPAAGSRKQKIISDGLNEFQMKNTPTDAASMPRV